MAARQVMAVVVAEPLPNAVLASTQKSFMKISIIIPVLNEEKNLSVLLNRLQTFDDVDHEVVVVDGGSFDNSLFIAQENSATVIVSKPGRAVQMNSGSAVATGDVFLFLHADTLLPELALSAISSSCLTDNCWGRFDVRLSSDKLVYRLIESLINLRSRLTSVATGDQAIFIRRDLFVSLGGFPEIVLMEDVAFSKILKKHSAPVCLKRKVITSSRRWETKGVIATVLLMWKLRLYYFLGVAPEELKNMYR